MTSPLRVTINSMAYGAAGVGRSDEGKVIFVPRTAPGDVIDVELTHQTASYSEGVVQAIVEPSPLRVKPSALMLMFAVAAPGCIYRILRS